MSAGISIRTLRSASEIEEIRGIWTSWQHHPNIDIDFYLTVNDSRPQILRPHVMVLSRENGQDAILVARIVEERVPFKVGYFTILAPKARVLRIAYNGWLGNISLPNSEAFVNEVLNALRRREADAAIVSHVRFESPAFRAATRVPGPLCRDFFSGLQLQPHRCMTIPDSVEDFQRRLSYKVRKNHRRQAKILLQDFGGKVSIQRFTETDGLARLIRDAEEVARKTYQRGLGVGFEDNAEMRERLRLEAQKGTLLAFILYIGDRPCAFWIGTVYERTFHSGSMGYDPDFSRYSPGMFLVIRVIEEFCEGKRSGDVAQVDFGLGDAQYKEILGDCAWQEGSVYIFAPTFKGLRLNALRTPALLIDELTKRVLERTRLLARIKRVWRDSAGRRSAQKSLENGSVLEKGKA